MVLLGQPCGRVGNRQINEDSLKSGSFLVLKINSILILKRESRGWATLWTKIASNEALRAPALLFGINMPNQGIFIRVGSRQITKTHSNVGLF